MSGHIFAADHIARFTSSVYIKLGVPRQDSELLANTLVQADLWGHHSHGVMRTGWYAARLKSGAVQAATTPEVVMDSGPVALIDGGDGLGQVIAAQAMNSSIARAKNYGVGVVSVRNSGHFGTAMYFTRMAAAAGCIGLLSTNASPAMAPWGGREKLIGNNPWSISAPAGRYAPLTLDVANTAVARGKLYLAQNRGEPIPEGWALDAEGRPTTDAAAGIAGNILPFAGHKGYAISVMMDVLSGALSGSQTGTGVVGPYVAEGRSGVGHLAVALDIAAFRPLSDFTADIERMIERISSSPLAAGAEEIHYPGEPEARAERRQRTDGIALPEKTVAALDRLADELGIPKLSEANGRM